MDWESARNRDAAVVRSLGGEDITITLVIDPPDEFFDEILGSDDAVEASDLGVVAPGVRLELTTCGLTVRCSAN